MTNRKNRPAPASEAVVGFFIRVNNEEEADLREFLKDSGYDDPPDGLREMVLDCIYGEEEPEAGPGILDGIRNPEIIMKTGAKIGEILFGKKKPPP